MLTGTAREPAIAARFVLAGVATSLGLFAMLRLGWIESHVVLPITRLQGTAAVGLFGTPALPVEVTIACSGADALALCLGAVLAYPARWWMRLAGAAGGTALVLGINTLRIGTLGRSASSPALFETLHLYVWPAVLTLAIAGYVFAWMRAADRAPCLSTQTWRPRPTRRFVAFTIGFLVLFAAVSTFNLENLGIGAWAGYIARVAAAILGLAGVSAHADANLLWMPHGAFLVTQECVLTPLIPVYLAAVCAYATSWRRLAWGVFASLPLFTILGIVRLLLVAVPDVVASPMFLVHAFYQLLLGATVVFLAAVWRHGQTAPGHALAGVGVGALFLVLLGPLSANAVAYAAGTLDDPQGAIAFLPAFQIGLYLALWVAAFVAAGWRRFLAGLMVLGLTQTAGLLLLRALASHAGLSMHVRDVRGWAVAGPVLIFAAAITLGRPRR
ncbi:MAG: hypothetical protein AB7J63_04465 [Vicinamibacterales bacterium]